MSGRPLVGVSLKLYFDHLETLDWCDRVAEVARSVPAVAAGEVEFAVFPSYGSIPAAVERLDGIAAVGAQDVGEDDRGPRTGEVSARQLAQLGCRYVEIGHAERRARFGETDELVARKVAAAWRNGLTPFLCVGEPERGDPEAAARVATAQLAAALEVVREHGQTGDLVVAYEPVWAIGAAEPAPVEHVRSVCSALAEAADAAGEVRQSRVVYGGSAGPGLLDALGPAVDGLFLGRFAHDPAALAAVLREAATRRAPGSGAAR